MRTSERDGGRSAPPRAGGEPVAGVVIDAALDDPGLATSLIGLVRLTLDATDLRDELRAHGGEVAGLPAGEVTFLFADVEGSTALLEALGERYADLLDGLRRLAGEEIGHFGGRVVDARADEVFAVFRRVDGAAAAAIAIQRRIAEAGWPDRSSVKVRIGLHTGRPDLTASGYVGLDVRRAARVMAAAHGGQVVATASVVDGLVGATGLSIRPLGRFDLRGLSEPVSIVQLDDAGRPDEFPPLRADAAG